MMLFKAKKVIVVTLILLLFGCSSTNSEEKEERFLAKKSEKVVLFIVGDERDSFDLEEDEGISNIESIFNASSLERAQQKYDFLKLKKEPTYVVFDDKEEIYRTNNYDQLVTFLKTEPKN